jgi:hypothetical protein
MKKIFVLSTVVCFFLISSMFSQEKDDSGFMVKMDKAPLVFSVSKDKSDEIWKRINFFITEYSMTKIQVATDLIIETNNPGTMGEFAYSASRTTKGDSVEFKVKCVGPAGSEKLADRNAHVLAYYAATGESIPSNAVIRR